MMREEGFTIIELLAAMVVGSLLLVALSWSVGSLARELRASSEKPKQHLEKRASSLTTLIEQALPQKDGATAIVAERERLIVVTPPPAALGASGPLQLTLRVESRGGGQALIAQFKATGDGTPLPAPANDDLPLVQGYREIWLDYARGSEGRASQLRRVTINFRDDKDEVTRLSAIPRTNSSGACRFDPISMSCRA